MRATMECPKCGAKFYSSAWHEMLAQGERCSCGGLLQAAEERAPLREVATPVGAGPEAARWASSPTA
jgi:NAD-dependent SIR2 family protein deacetylase